MKESDSYIMSILNTRHLNGWPFLYWTIGINAIAVLAYIPTQDLSKPTGILEMIQMTVRITVPFLYMAFVASALYQLWPNFFSRWLLKNRRYVGLGFAASMAWQLLFILMLWVGYWDYYMQEVYNFSSIAFEAPGYLLIFAMSITSFIQVRKKMSKKVWRALHWVCIYFLWFAITLTYYYELADGRDVQIIDYVYFIAGVTVYIVRLSAYLSQRIAQRANQ